MRLISNAGPSHRDELAGMFEGADEIRISVAFLRSKGLDAIQSKLVTCLKNGGRVRAHIGLDFYLTDPEALERLAALEARWPRCSVHLAAATGATFHPKAYVAITAGKIRAMVGSANLTGGALQTNDELSILLEGPEAQNVATQLLVWFDTLERDRRVEPVSDLLLLSYRDIWEKARKARERAEAEVAEVQPLVNLRRLSQLLKSYRASKEFAELAGRKEARTAAVKLQNEIAALAGRRLRRAETELIKDHLRDLMGSQGRLHLWHSDAIFRQGSRALDYPAQLARLFAEARAMGRRTPSQAYESVRTNALELPGVGVNMLTEILSTFQPARFPVFNRNTSGALAVLGLRPVSSTSKITFRGHHYARVEQALVAVRDYIAVDDFLSVDAFLNYVYFQTRS